MRKIKIEEEAMKKVYTAKEIKDIEQSVLHRKEVIGLETNYIKNEYKKRIDTHRMMLNSVESNLELNENILVSKINIPHSGGSGGMSVVTYYQGLFFTNKRIFIFNMNFKYEELEPMKIMSIDDILILRDKENFNGVRIEFKNKESIFLKSYTKEEAEITIIILKYLLENGIKFSKINKIIESLIY